MTEYTTDDTMDYLDNMDGDSYADTGGRARSPS